MRNFGRWSRTAVCSSIGMLTSPNEIDPFHSALAIRSDFCYFLLLQFLLRLEPVVEMLAVVAAALQVALVGAPPDVVVGSGQAGGCAALVGRRVAGGASARGAFRFAAGRAAAGSWRCGSSIVAVVLP